MSLIRRFWSLRLVLFLAGIGAMLLATSDHTGGQDTGGQDIEQDVCFTFETACDVEGFAAILSSTDQTEIDTYASTTISFDLEDSDFEADVQAGLFLNDFDHQVDSNEGGDDGTGFAETSMSDPVELDNDYGLEGDSFLLDLDACESDFIGSAFVDVDAAAPYIDNLNPAAASTETQGTLTINGTDLIDPFTQEIVLIFNDPGATFTLNSANDSKVVLNYSIAPNTTTGDQDLSLQTRFGTSNVVTFHIGDPTPVVKNVQPSSWQSGTDTPITITGQYFGCNPTVNISGPGVTGFSENGGATDTSISGTVSVEPVLQGGPATVTVTSQGCTSQGFLSTNPGQPNDGTNNSPEVAADTLPAATIQYFNGAIPQSVTVGQKIALTYQVNFNGKPYTIQSQTWTLQGTTIGSFTKGTAAPEPAGGPSQGEQAQAVQDLTTQGINFYWISAGTSPPATNTVSLSYCANDNQNNQQCTTTANNNVASANFSVDAPHLPSANPVSITTSSVNIYWNTRPDLKGVPRGPSQAFNTDPSKGPFQHGIKFVVQGQPPQNNTGQYQWVQLLNTDTNQQITNISPGLRTCSTFTVADGKPELDTEYPVKTNLANTNVQNDTTWDDPSVAMGYPGPPQNSPPLGLWQRTFSATMNLRWQPNPDSLCGTDPSCTIPVPLGSMNWGYSGCAVNSFVTQPSTDLTQNQTWVSGGLNCPQNSQGPNIKFNASDTSSGNNFGYLSWSATVGKSCH